MQRRRKPQLPLHHGLASPRNGIAAVLRCSECSIKRNRPANHPLSSLRSQPFPTLGSSPSASRCAAKACRKPWHVTRFVTPTGVGRHRTVRTGRSMLHTPSLVPSFPCTVPTFQDDDSDLCARRDRVPGAHRKDVYGCESRRAGMLARVLSSFPCHAASSRRR